MKLVKLKLQTHSVDIYCKLRWACLVEFFFLSFARKPLAFKIDKYPYVAHSFLDSIFWQNMERKKSRLEEKLRFEKRDQPGVYISPSFPFTASPARLLPPLPLHVSDWFKASTSGNDQYLSCLFSINFSPFIASCCNVFRLDHGIVNWSYARSEIKVKVRRMGGEITPAPNPHGGFRIS